MTKLALLGFSVVVAVFAVGCASSEPSSEKQGSTTSHLEDGEESEQPASFEEQPADEETPEVQNASWRDWQRCMDRTSGKDCDRALDI